MTNKKTDNPNEMFVWDTPNGEKVSLLPFNRLPSKVFRTSRGKDEMEVMFTIIEAAADEESLAEIDELPLEDLGRLFEDWSESAGTELGKH